MRTFTDRTGRQWSVDLTIASVRRIKSLCDVDLLDDRQGGLMEMYGRSDMRLIDILFAAVKPQADALTVTDEQFGEAIGGKEMGQAIRVLMEEIIDFFLQARPPLGHALQSLYRKTHDHEQRQLEAAERMASLPEIDRYLSQTIEKAETLFATTIGNLCTNSRESSGSTQEH